MSETDAAVKKAATRAVTMEEEEDGKTCTKERFTPG
jgi:hypothetical protein